MVRSFSPKNRVYNNVFGHQTRIWWFGVSPPRNKFFKIAEPEGHEWPRTVSWLHERNLGCLNLKYLDD